MTVEVLISALRERRAADSSMVGWEVAEIRGRGVQRLYRDVSGALTVHQSRLVHDRTIRLTTWVRNCDKMGAGVIDIDVNLPPGPQVELSVTVATTSANRPWNLPIPPSKPYPEVETADPNIVESPAQTLARLESRLQAAIDRESGIRVNSAEIYVNWSRREVFTHSGIHHVHRTTEIDLECAAEPLPGPNSQEVQNGLAGVAERDLDIERFVAETAAETRHLGDTIEPSPGSDTPVLVRTRAAAELFSALTSCLSARRAFLKVGSLAVGEAVHTGVLRGDPVGVDLDPFQERMVCSHAATESGQIPARARVIDNSVVQHQCVDHRYGQYLDLPPNYVGGNAVVDLGVRTTDELRAVAPGAIEVLKFSSLVVDRATLTWSSEIKLGRQRGVDGQFRWLKGGVISGDFRANLSDVLLSSEEGIVNEPGRFGMSALGYRGPAAMLIRAGVSVVGEGA